MYPYAQHKDTDIWCMAWAFDDEEPQIWTPEHLRTDIDERRFQPRILPDEIFDHINAGGEIRAWNAQFERVIWNEIMVKRYGAVPVELEQWVCSAAEAAAMALPRGLDQAARVLGVSQKKDTEGYNLMMRMTRPRKVNDDGSIVWWEVEEKKQRLFEYCKQDVRVERAIVKALRRLTPREREIYLLDQRVNDRGIQIDLELVDAAVDVAEDGITRANALIRELTDGTVSGVTKTGQLREWLGKEGVANDSVSKAAVRGLLEQDLEPRVREVLNLRADAGRSSIAKLESMRHVACTDRRARGLMLYHGASTGRWTGKLLQPHNFPRGEVDRVEDFIPDMLRRDYDAVDLVAHPIVVISSMLRSMLTAAPGMELIGGDYSAIEARVLNWLAGQDDIVRLFAEGKDVYKYNAAKLYNIALEDVQKFPHRQTGKFQELGCGYGMGAKKAVSAAKTVYQLELNEAQAKDIVKGYRDTHSRVVAFWYETEGACIRAVNSPGVPYRFGASLNLTAIQAGAYLYILLPSKRPLCYAAPRIVEAPMPWDETQTKPQLEISGVDSYSKQWGRLRLYGGLLVENIVQAVSRDLMAEGMLRLEEKGYAPILSVHDEVVCEVEPTFGSVEEFEALMSALPAWAEGCPVAAEGWRGFRYRK